MIKTISSALLATALMFSQGANAEELETVTFEVGMGANNAVIGATANFLVSDNVEIFAGAGLGYVAGVKYYLSDNLRLTANYGTNAILVDAATLTIDKKFEGVNLGIGYISDRNGGWVIEAMYLDTDNADDYIKSNPAYKYDGSSGSVKLSFGYRW